MNSVAEPNLPNPEAVDALIKSIRIPPRPSLLTEVQAELSREEPDPQRIAQIIVNDPGMSGALLKLANSPYVGLAKKVRTIEQAITVLGINQCAAMLTGLLAREAVRAEGPALAQFWDTSTKRSQAVVYMARKLRICAPDVAHTFGLFCDIGVPLLMDRFPDYRRTYAIARQDETRRFTAIEDAAHSTNHAAIGCLLARNWGLAEAVSAAILLHHDYDAIRDEANHPLVRSLIAICVFAEKAIEKYGGNSDCTEWNKGGQIAADHLLLPENDREELVGELVELFRAN